MGTSKTTLFLLYPILATLLCGCTRAGKEKLYGDPGDEGGYDVVYADAAPEAQTDAGVPADRVAPEARPDDTTGDAPTKLSGDDGGGPEVHPADMTGDAPTDLTGDDGSGPEVYPSDTPLDTSDTPLDTPADVEPLPPGCCLVDEDCGVGEECVVTPEAIETGDEGLCMPILELYSEYGVCYQDSDCFEPADCIGALVGSCHQLTGVEPHHGNCLEEQCCLWDSHCDPGFTCMEEYMACIPTPPPGQCWEDTDCPFGKTCMGEYLCPCAEDDNYSCTPCQMACPADDKMGNCTNLYEWGCCQTDFDCNVDDDALPMVCVHSDWGIEPGWGVCMPMAQLQGNGWCWSDDDCEFGSLCHGAAACGCGLDCDMAYEGPGVCISAGGECVAVEEGWLQEYCDAASVVIFDGEECVETCPGCCWCEPFCQFVFYSIEECEAACLPAYECPTYIGALAASPYRWIMDDLGGEMDWCPVAGGMGVPCETDADCPPAGDAIWGEYCVLGNCVYCWNDGQCPDGQVCRTGRCVEPDPMACNMTPTCGGWGCDTVHISEDNCPVCVCESIFDKQCEDDTTCLPISSFPYKSCVYGRCAECRNDEDCQWGHCLPPGLCYDMTPDQYHLYGTWLIGWSGGMDHYSYFRFEPDGTLRRGHYQEEGAWSDDIPPMPCWPAGVVPSPLVGTWEPVMTESGFLVVKMTLNISCDDGDGWSNRYAVSIVDDMVDATFTDIDGDMDYWAVKVPADKCTADFSTCEPPDWFGW